MVCGVVAFAQHIIMNSLLYINSESVNTDTEYNFQIYLEFSECFARLVSCAFTYLLLLFLLLLLLLLICFISLFILLMDIFVLYILWPNA